MERQSISRMAGILTFSLFCAILILDYADQAILNPQLNLLLLEFFNDTQNVIPLGYVQSTFTILSAISMMVFGYFADRTSRRIICLIG